MIKPSDKILIGWFTLLATFASANVGRASANGMAASTEQAASNNVANLVVTEQSEVTEPANVAVEVNAQTILPESDLPQPKFSAQPVPNQAQLKVAETEPGIVIPSESSEFVAALPANVSTTKLEHLVSKATRPLSNTESIDRTNKLNRLVSTATRELPTNPLTTRQSLPNAEDIEQVARLNHVTVITTQELPLANPLTHVTVDALPSTRVISPASSVTARGLEPNVPTEIDSSTARAEDRLITESRPSSIGSEETSQVSQTGVLASESIAIPEGAMATSVVYAPNSLHANVSDIAIGSASVNQELSRTSSLAQTPVPDSSGSVGDSFSPEDLTDEELRQLLSVDVPFFPSPTPAPGSSFGTPTAYGANEGDAFIGLAGVTEGDRSDTDGSISLGAGVGNAVSSVGIEFNVGIISLDGFADDGQIGFKVHKIIPEADNLAVAVGWSNPVTWGDANDAEETIYGVVTQRFDLQPNKSNRLPLTVSAGVGTGSFRSKGAIAAGDNPPNFFGSVGLRVIPEMSVVSSWTGSALNLGISAAPFDFPLILFAGASDVTDNTREGTRFSASIGYGFKF